jgi:AcrR family transcriptional regulator
MSTASPGSIRPGGRTLRVASAVFEATLSVLAEQGYSGLSIERIAERSGVNKTTIYRRWQSKDAVLAAALDNKAADVFPIPSTESISDDLRAFARALADFLTDDSPSIAGVQRALFSDAAREPLIAEIKRDFFTRRHEAAASMVDAAIDRGELPGDVDSRELVGLVAAQLYYRRLATGETIDHAVADRAAATALIAVEAGACRRR